MPINNGQLSPDNSPESIIAPDQSHPWPLFNTLHAVFQVSRKECMCIEEMPHLRVEYSRNVSLLRQSDKAAENVCIYLYLWVDARCYIYIYISGFCPIADPFLYGSGECVYDFVCVVCLMVVTKAFNVTKTTRFGARLHTPMLGF